MKKFKVGLQLYSIRDDMEKDMDAALAKVKEMGSRSKLCRDKFFCEQEYAVWGSLSFHILNSR